MKMICLSLLLIFSATGCGFANIDFFQTAHSLAIPVTPVGGNCITPYVFSELGFHPQIDGAIIGRTITTTRNAGSGASTYEHYADMSVLLPTTGIIYAEMTINSITGPSTDWSEVSLAVAQNNLSNYISLNIVPSSSGAYWSKEVAGGCGGPCTGVMFSGQDIRGNLPYTISIAFNTTTGDVNYTDTLGNSGFTTTNTNMIANPNLIIGGAGGVQNVGNSVTTHYNFGDTAFLFTPPVGSQDICGNSL